jgi:hypothetical protein
MEKKSNAGNGKWRKPELIVLVRSKPEESVLNACKGGSTTGPSAYKTYCHVFSDCGSCSSIDAS